MNKKAFTLVELIIYIALSVILFLALFTFVVSINETRERSYVISEVENQGINLINKITRDLKTATNINTPTQSNNSQNLSFLTRDGKNINFILADSVLKIIEDANPAIELHNDSVIVSELVFRNLSKADTKDNIKIELKLKFNSQDTKLIHNYEKTFYATVNLR